MKKSSPAKATKRVGAASISGASRIVPLGRGKTGQVGRNLLIADDVRATVRGGIASWGAFAGVYYGYTGY